MCHSNVIWQCNSVPIVKLPNDNLPMYPSCAWLCHSHCSINHSRHLKNTPMQHQCATQMSFGSATVCPSSNCQMAICQCIFLVHGCCLALTLLTICDSLKTHPCNISAPLKCHLAQQQCANHQIAKWQFANVSFLCMGAA